MFRSIFISFLSFYPVGTLADNGIDYTKFMTCESPGGMVRFDEYFGYSLGSPGGNTPRIQMVVTGDIVNELLAADIYPTKPSSVAGEFLIDSLERGYPVDELSLKSTPGANAVFSVRFRADDGVLSVTRHFAGNQELSAEITDLHCAW